MSTEEPTHEDGYVYGERFGVELVDPATFRVPLPPEVQAQFEPLCGLMILNTDWATYQSFGAAYDPECKTFTTDEAGTDILRAINHETHHYFQTIGSGFVYSYAATVQGLVEKHIIAALRSEMHEAEWYIKTQESILSGGDAPENNARALRINELVYDMDMLSRRRSKTASGDASWTGAVYPELFQEFSKLEASRTATTADGLSALGIIESSSLVYGHALTASGERHGLQDRIEEDLEYLDDRYVQAYRFTKTLCGSRTVEVLLPAAALALRYETPAKAYPWLVKHVLECAAGEEIETARRVASAPPNLDAGRYLGTAADVRSRGTRMRYTLYDKELDQLSSGAWSFDEFELLAEPKVAIDVPWFSVATVLQDGVLQGHVASADLVLRAFIGNVVLRRGSLDRHERDFGERLMGMLSFAFDPDGR